jgi:hypothetical protein
MSYSVVWATLFKNQSVVSAMPSHSDRRRTDVLPVISGSNSDLATSIFPDLDFINTSLKLALALFHLQRNSSSRIPQQQSTSTFTSELLASYSSLGPFLTRLAANRSIAAPMFTIKLQRVTVDISRSPGLLSIGELPPGVNDNSLTWTPLRRYTAAQGGLRSPSMSPSEVRHRMLFTAYQTETELYLIKRSTPSLGRYF